jgi:hypothetical protein
VWGYSQGHNASSRLVDSNSLQMDEALVDAWPNFPGLKVGQSILYSSFLIIWWH